MKRLQYPFTAIVGQEEMKIALLLNAIDPKIGGVLIKGEKGTAKSTAVRALTEILPPFSENAQEMTVVELPVNATEDRVVGTIDIEAALSSGEKKFEPGILAKAHENILYIDEINLLDDHVVDVLLDAAAMGVNTVEREGISYSHPARFVLVGTMNPEEGDLRPQLIDRFGLSVEVKGEKDAEKRVEVILRRMAFEKDKEAFIASYEEEEKALRERVLAAREMLASIPLDDEILYTIARISIGIGVDGHRPDITMMYTARALAAYRGHEKITKEDILEAALLVLPHRMRRTPFATTVLDREELAALIEE